MFTDSFTLDFDVTDTKLTVPKDGANEFVTVEGNKITAKAKDGETLLTITKTNQKDYGSNKYAPRLIKVKVSDVDYKIKDGGDYEKATRDFNNAIG